ncbi:MAG: hypothetical protein ABI806_08035 [Candidatus Solibacter sp.]
MFRTVIKRSKLFPALLMLTAILAADSTAERGNASLWTEPGDVAARDLYYGAGGKAHQPRAPFKFVKEDLDGTNPKFVVEDASGAKWKVKLGIEARPETVASRITWAVGYHVNEDYFLPEIVIAGMPEHLHRGNDLVEPGGVLREVRLKRDPEGEKLGTWSWKDSDFTGTREWNGLRALMAVMNNWDLKDVNNAIYLVDNRRIYMVSDLGATFGSASRTWPRDRSKGNLDSYSESKFISKVSSDFVDFQAPARPSLIYAFNPKEYVSRVRMESLGRHVPVADARWIGQLLSRLTPTQLRDAFRCAGYPPGEVEYFVRLLSDRIIVLSEL